MVKRIFYKTYKTHTLNPTNKVIARKGNRYVFIKNSDPENRSRLLSTIRALGLTFITFTGFALPLISWKFRNGFLENWRAIFTGDRKVEKYGLANKIFHFKANNTGTDFVILGNEKPEKAQVFCFPENHLGQNEREAWGDIINKYYRPGDIILIEGLVAGKVGKAKSYSISRYINPKYPVQGWEPPNYKEIMAVSPGHVKFVKKLEQLNAFAEEGIKFPKDDQGLENILERYRKLANYFSSDKKLTEQWINDLKLDIEKCDDGQDFMFQYIMCTAIEKIEKKIDRAQFAKISRSDDLKLIGTIEERNRSLCDEIEKYSDPSRRVFVIAGFAHFLKHPSPFNSDDTIQIKQTLEQIPYVMYAEKKHYNHIAKFN